VVLRQKVLPDPGEDMLPDHLVESVPVGREVLRLARRGVGGAPVGVIDDADWSEASSATATSRRRGSSGSRASAPSSMGRKYLTSQQRGWRITKCADSS
jgi:hypothetical protein